MKDTPGTKRFPGNIRTKYYEAVLDESHILISFVKATERNEVLKIAKELELELQENEKSEKNYRRKINHTDRLYWLRSADPISEEQFILIENKLGDQATWIGRAYKNKDAAGREDYFCPVPSVILINKDQKKGTGDPVKEFALKKHELKSKYLTEWDYYELEDPKKINAFELQKLLEQKGFSTMFESIPIYSPLTSFTPNDRYWNNQWNLERIKAPEGWDITQGNENVVIAVIDTGCDLHHPDLQFSSNGVNLATMDGTDSTGTYSLSSEIDFFHGTAVAGIIAAKTNNTIGVAGVAGKCKILPIAFYSFSDVCLCNGINYATDKGARIINMSLGLLNGNGLIEVEIQEAYNQNVFICAATGNEELGNEELEKIRYPAKNPLVMACGATTREDNRKKWDNIYKWSSNYGDIGVPGDSFLAGVSVMAPGVEIPTTFIRNLPPGINLNGYDPEGYHLFFDGTSAATPQVAGLAALLMSKYPQLTNVQVRNIIERTTTKAGTLPYKEMEGFPNGTRNEEMGYGLINIFQALNFADVMIKDWSGDTGIEPSTPPSNNFYQSPDIVVAADAVYDNSVFNSSTNSEIGVGRTNYFHVRVFNNGPAVAKNVKVNIRVAPYVGIESKHPKDWAAPGALHVIPSIVQDEFDSIAAGASVIAIFSISSAQTQELVAYTKQMNQPGLGLNPPHLNLPTSVYQPTVLAAVFSDNDYAFDSSDFSVADIVKKKNNFAMKTFSFFDRLIPFDPSGLGQTTKPAHGPFRKLMQWLRRFINKIIRFFQSSFRRN